jgi:hypothetical protein
MSYLRTHSLRHNRKRKPRAPNNALSAAFGVDKVGRDAEVEAARSAPRHFVRFDSLKSGRS